MNSGAGSRVDLLGLYTVFHFRRWDPNEALACCVFVCLVCRRQLEGHRTIGCVRPFQPWTLKGNLHDFVNSPSASILYMYLQC